MEDVFRLVQKKLDTMSNGFPATQSGVEMEIIRELFDEQSGAIFIQMSEKPERIEEIHKRLGGDYTDLSALLDKMSHAGLLRRDKKKDTIYYAAVPYVVGIFEHQINRMDESLAKKMQLYFDEAFGKTVQAHGTPILRTIPVNKDIVMQWPVAPFDDAASLLDQQSIIALAPCICRLTSQKAGKGCNHSQETCLIFGSYAEYYVENKMARFISVDEAKKVIKKSEKEGLVIQPFNAQRTGGMCSCCGCCCGILRSIKLQDEPAEAVKSNYFAQVDAELCHGCEECIDRCQVEAITMTPEDIAFVHLNRCIGCGLCVTTCSSEAITLSKKTNDFQYVPPKTTMRTYSEIYQARQLKGEITPHV